MHRLPSEDALRDEIHMLRAKMLELHTKAWKYRMEGDATAMQNAHRVIRAYNKRMRDCQWAVEYVQVSVT
jgi:hypothetical protein